MYSHAITRRPGPDLAHGLSTVDLGAPDWPRALVQHAAYVAALRDLGVQVLELPALPGQPDACFVEDVAVVLPELAVVTRPGAPSRRGEVASVAEILAQHRELETIEAPGTLDGGDVLVAGRSCWIGLSGRTNAAGADQLAALLVPRGYDCRTVKVTGGLHLKSCVNAAGAGTLIIAEALAEREEFAGWQCLAVPAAETYACNTLDVNGTLLVPAGYPATAVRLRELGRPLIPLDTSEYRKLDGGLTCLSLRF